MALSKKLNSKGQGLTMNKIVIIVLVLMVLTAVIIFIFRADLIEKLRSSPGYTYSEEDTEIVVSADVLAARSGCYYPLGYVGGENYIYINNVKTNVFWNKGKDASDGTVRLDRSAWIGDVDIGQIDEDNYLSIDSSWFDRSKQYSEPGIPTLDRLRIIDEAFMQANSNKLCKSERGWNDTIEKRNSLISAMIGSGSSYSLELEFTDGTDDIVTIWWDFKGNQAAATVKPNGDSMSPSTLTKSIENWRAYIDNEGSIYSKDRESIKTLLLSTSPSDLSKNIYNLINKDKSVKIYGKGTEVFGLARVNNLLYGADSALRVDIILEQIKKVGAGK